MLAICLRYSTRVRVLLGRAVLAARGDSGHGHACGRTPTATRCVCARAHTHTVLSPQQSRVQSDCLCRVTCTRNSGGVCCVMSNVCYRSETGHVCEEHAERGVSPLTPHACHHTSITRHRWAGRAAPLAVFARFSTHRPRRRRSRGLRPSARAPAAMSAKATAERRERGCSRTARASGVRPCRSDRSTASLGPQCCRSKRQADTCSA